MLCAHGITGNGDLYAFVLSNSGDRVLEQNAISKGRGHPVAELLCSTNEPPFRRRRAFGQKWHQRIAGPNPV
jgi:hypothetical protein